MRRPLNEFSGNRSIERTIARLLATGLPSDPTARYDLLRLHVGDGLIQGVDTTGAVRHAATRLTVRLLRDFGRLGREAMAQLLAELAEDAEREEWAAAAQAAVRRLDTYQAPSVTLDDAAPAIDADRLHAAIQRTVGRDGAPLRVTPEAIDQLADSPVYDFDAYLSRCMADAERQPVVDGRFVALSLLIDRRKNGVAQGPERFSIERGRYDGLQAALDDNEDCELVLVGAPGAGKTTLLRRLQFELCRAALKGASVPLPFMVHLAEYGQDERGALPDPATWLASQWHAVMPSVSFEQALAGRPFVLLLDALNEMPRHGDTTLGQRIEVWQRWLARFHAQTDGRHRVVFSCRLRDLSASLSSRQRTVRLLEIDSLTDKQVERFLAEHAGEQAARIENALKRRKLKDLYRTPLSLTLLLDLIDLCGDVPESPAALFTGHVCQALRREIEGRNPRFAAGRLLTEADVAHMAQRPYDIDDPYTVPDDGPLFRALADFAYAMQKGDAGERTHVVMKRRSARDLYAGLAVAAALPFDDLLAAGADLGLISQQGNKIAFVRQPHQEYLAARAWAEAGPHRDYSLVAPPWTAETRDVRAVVEALDEDEPLPAPPSTGWEETVLMGAEMADDDAVIDGLEAVNMALAGRAAARRSDTARKRRLRAALWRQCQDADVDLRVRIQAGEALGVLGHPAFVEKRGPEGPFIEPPMVDVPGGEFMLGDERYAESSPAGVRRVDAFRLGRFPVTRAEYARFVEAGGYEDPRWWPSPEAQRWFQGDGVGDGERKEIRTNIARLRREPNILDDLTPPQRKYWRAHLERSDEELDAWFDEVIDAGKQSAPWGWDNQKYAHATYPVIGVSFFEATAYIEWINVQTGVPYRLPTEFEWERAARGLRPSRVFPWGDDLDPLQHANVYDSHLRGLTPVGVFPQGRTREGLNGLAGNVLEWTASAGRKGTEPRAGPMISAWCGVGLGTIRIGSARGAYRFRDSRSTSGTTTSVFASAFRPPSRKSEPWNSADAVGRSPDVGVHRIIFGFQPRGGSFAGQQPKRWRIKPSESACSRCARKPPTVASSAPNESCPAS